MSMLETLSGMLDSLGIPVETGVFSGRAPDTYVVLTPISDVFDGFADNRPQYDICEVRISLYTKSNYLDLKLSIEEALLDGGFTITQRRLIGREDDSGYYHYAIDVAKNYELEE